MTGLSVEAVGPDGRVLARDRVGHGECPAQALWRNGFRLGEVLRSELRADGRVTIVAYAVPSGPGDLPPPSRPVERDPDLRLVPGEAAVPVQRVAAYALVAGDRGILLTQLSTRTHAAGSWGLPGGGLHAGEAPEAAVRREVAEESGQRVVVGELLGVHDAHWVGRAPSGRLEDFHVVRLVYRATCPDPGEPFVGEVDGTTAAAAWVRPAELRSLDLSAAWAPLLAGLAGLAGRA